MDAGGEERRPVRLFSKSQRYLKLTRSLKASGRFAVSGRIRLDECAHGGNTPR